MSDQETQITVIGPDTRIKGEMSFERTARILGQFEGRVQSTGELQIGTSAQCQATLEASTVIVDGTVEGNIVARDRIQLNGSARVNGDVVAEKLVVAEGASFNGRCRVGPEAVAEAERNTPEPRATAAPRVAPSEPAESTNGGASFDWVESKSAPTPTGAGWGPRPATPTEGAA